MTEAPRQYGTDMPCFDPEIGGRLRVTLDGVVVRNVIAYDMDAGQVLRYKTDEAGQFVLNIERDEVERELLTGEVVATLTG